MTINVTITKPGVTDQFGRAMTVGTTYAVDDAFGISLISQLKASDAGNSLVTPGITQDDPLSIQYVNAAAIAAPTAQMLRSYSTVFVLNASPYTRYRTNGTILVLEAQYTLDASGNITGLVGAGGPLTPSWYAKRAPIGFALVEPPVSGITTNAGANCTINSSAATTVAGETVWRVNATATNTTNNYFEMNVPLQSAAFAASDMTAEFICDDMSKIDGGSGGIVYYLGTASYSIFANAFISSQITPSTTSPFCINGLSAHHVREAQWSKSGYTDETGNQAWVNCKIRVYITNGQTLTFSLRAIRVASFRRKGRIAIVSDDGYASWHKMGVPIMREFGFVSSNAIIYDDVGSGDKATLATLQAYVAEGNECLAHGPNNGSDGTGNLFTAWSTNAQRIADVNACRDYLIANGLCTQYGARSYIWPQGRFAESTTDYSMLALMQSNGYTAARAAIVPTTFYMHKANAVSSLNLSSLTMPIVGHTWTSAGTEAANIASINAKIAATAAARGDCSLMLHRVVGPDAAAQATEISSNRLRQICEAIRAEVDAGTLEVVLYSEFAK